MCLVNPHIGTHRPHAGRADMFFPARRFASIGILTPGSI